MSTELLQLVNKHDPGMAVLPSSEFSRVEIGGYLRWKRAVDLCLVGLVIVPGILLMSILLVLVRLTSPGPALFRQVRVGRHGRKFVMYKIRTMVHDAERDTGPKWADTDDARLTRFGKLIRRMHLDELPQLLNVLQGDMSMVGPRPERPAFVRMLAEEIPGYGERLAVPPGITGLAQVNLPPDTDLDSVRRKLVLDLEYIRSANLFLDVRLFLYSTLRLLMLPGTLLARLLCLKRHVRVPASMYRMHVASDGEELLFKQAGVTPGKPR